MPLARIESPSGGFLQIHPAADRDERTLVAGGDQLLCETGGVGTQQTLYARSLNLLSGTGGTDNSASMGARKQVITVDGDVNLIGGASAGIFGGAAIIYLVGRLCMLLINVKAPPQSLDAPSQVQLPPMKPGTPGEMVDWGSTKAVGADLFGPGLFVFEAISILLLIAVVGAIAIARHIHEDPHAAEPASGSGPQPGANP